MRGGWTRVEGGMALTQEAAVMQVHVVSWGAGRLHYPPSRNFC